MRNKIVRILGIVIAVMLLIGLIPVGAAADTGIITGKFTYMPSFADIPQTDDFYYSDGYFKAPSTQKNDHLTSMSMALALSSMEVKGDSYVTALLKDIGFEDVLTEDMTATPTRDTIGTAMAHKKIGGYDVVALSIRGHKYGAEWASNLNAGDSGNIEGFDTASKKVIARLKDYIASHNLSNVKIWIAGYSRAGSVTDLTGVYINEHLEEFQTTANDLFVYCFEAPRCCASNKIYNNIFCVRNKNDIITYVYPEAWGLYTNGVEITIGQDLTVKKVKIDLLESDKVVELGDIPMDEFNQEFIDFLADELSREKFSGDFDDSVADLIELYFNKSSAELARVAAYIQSGDFVKNAMDNDRFMYVLMFEGISGVMLHNSDKMYRQFTDELLLLMDEMNITANTLGMTEEEYQSFRDSLYPILREFGPVFVKDFRYRFGVDMDSVMPEGYDDPDYDPQTDEEPILTYDQYKEKQAQEDDSPSEPESDEDRAWSDVYNSDAYQRGNDDAKAGRDPITEAPLPGNPQDKSDTYLAVYAEQYLEFYMDGYTNGLEELNPKSEDYDNGIFYADTIALLDARKDALTEDYMASYNDTPAPRIDGTPYSEDFLLGYKHSYHEAYINYYNESLEYYKALNLYHLGGFIAQISDILPQHYPQNNWELVKSMDSYYSKSTVVGDADSDGDVTILDATRIQRWLAELCDMDGAAYSGAKLTDKQIHAADTTGDGVVSILDVTRIQRRLAGFPVTFPTA